MKRKKLLFISLIALIFLATINIPQLQACGGCGPPDPATMAKMKRGITKNVVSFFNSFHSWQIKWSRKGWTATHQSSFTHLKKLLVDIPNGYISLSYKDDKNQKRRILATLYFDSRNRRHLIVSKTTFEKIYTGTTITQNEVKVYNWQRSIPKKILFPKLKRLFFKGSVINGSETFNQLATKLRTRLRYELPRHGTTMTLYLEDYGQSPHIRRFKLRLRWDMRKGKFIPM